MAIGVGFIALAEGERLTPAMVDDAIRHGAVQRVRPKAMTVAVILAGLLPIVWGGLSGDGSGAEIMSRIAAPMLGGMLSAPLLSLLVVPAEAGLRSGRHGADFSREIDELAETRHPTPTTRAQNAVSSANPARSDENVGSR